MRAIVIVFALYQIAYIAGYLVRPHPPEQPLFGDFLAFWSFARFSVQVPAGNIYDPEALQAFQLALPVRFHGFYPYPYPPIFLLFLRPLAGLGYIPAYLTWMGASLGAYAVAVAGPDWRSPRVWLSLVAPTTLMAIISGQNGLLCAALLIGGFRLMRRWPLWAGLVLGCLVFKPQFFVLVPLVLIAGRRWRALAGVVAGVLGLTLLSSAVFGPMLWLNWLRAIPVLLQLAADNREHLLPIMPTVTATLMQTGVAIPVVQIVQSAVTLGVGAVLIWLFHRSRHWAEPAAMDIAALQVGVFLVSPYAFLYDMPMVTDAAITSGARGTAPGPWRVVNAGLPLVAFVLPVLMLGAAAHGWPIGAAVLCGLFGVIARAAWRD